MTSTVRVRFAPSPTGYLHVGSARTALFNYLFARGRGGVFILRIEDTDRTRYQADACKEIYESLRWLGLQWDEGPEAGGSHGPYVQSERTELYRKAADELLARGTAYRCFCPPERLQKLREEQEKAGVAKVVGYDRHCRDLPAEESQRLLAAATPSIVRLRIPLGRKIIVKDGIRGDIEYDTGDLDDLVLLKSDGFPTYHLANVVDDHAMEISHVLRGDEWISSTPKHVLLYEAFGWQPPQFAHLPLILSADGGKLSKRKGAASVMDYKRAGYLPEALFNFLALLGWAPGDDREKMNVREMAEAFAIEKISPKASVFDEKKLEWMNGLYMQDRSVESIMPEIAERLKARGLLDTERGADERYRHRVVTLLKDRSKRLTDLVDGAVYFFVDPESYDPAAVKKVFRDDAAGSLEVAAARLQALETFDAPSAERLYRSIADEEGISAGKLIHPTRLAVSGVSVGPGLFEMLETLGKQTVVRRIKRAVEWLGARESGSPQDGAATPPGENKA